MNKYTKYFEENINSVADLISIKLAPINQIFSIYPDEHLGWDFYMEIKNECKEVKIKYSVKTQQNLINSFRSHDFKCYSDIYGHQGLNGGYVCKKCKRKIKLPGIDRKNWSDDFILAYHYVYGHQKRFGGRITKCKG